MEFLHPHLLRVWWGANHARRGESSTCAIYT